MREEDFRKSRIVEELLLSDNGLLVTNENDNSNSLCGRLGMDYKNRENNEYSLKTLYRYIKELQEAGYVIKEERGRERFCRINYESLITDKSISQKERKEMLLSVIRSGAFDVSYKILNFLESQKEDDWLSEERINRYSHTIRENINYIPNEKENIRLINEAMKKRTYITVEYGQEKKTLVPLCYLVSSDGKRMYLYYFRKNNLAVEPFRVEKIRHVTCGNQQEGLSEEAAEEYLKRIRKAWNISISDSDLVKLRMYKDSLDLEVIEKKLKDYFGEPLERTDDYDVYGGELVGTDDFMSWVRGYPSSCIIVEPERLRDKMIESLKMRKERYGMKYEK